MNDLTDEQKDQLAQTIKDDNYGIYVLGLLCKVLQYLTYYTGAASLLSMIGFNLPLASSSFVILLTWIMSYIALIMFVTPYYVKATK